MEFNFKRYFVSVFNMFAYSFVCSFVFAIFAMLIWFTFKFVGSGDSFLRFWNSQLSGAGFAGSVIGFCVGTIITIVKSVWHKVNRNGKELS